jgi:hypothetical protein
MVIIIFIVGIFMGFTLGLALMALLAARDHRLQWEEGREAPGYSPRRIVNRAFPAIP